jgi:chromosomal replication initiator protein
MIRLFAGRLPSGRALAVKVEPSICVEVSPAVAAAIPDAWITAQDLRPALLFAFPGRLSAIGIQDEVADFYGIGREQMRRPDGEGAREPRISHPRQVAMSLARELTKLSLPAIGRLFNRDHSTVIHAIKAVEKRAAVDPLLEMELEVLRERFAG